jgi:hypothetical protein
MSSIETVTSDLGQAVRLLGEAELDAVTGGFSQGGCIRLPGIVTCPPPPPPTPPWFGPLWDEVGRTGHLPT